MKSLVRPRRFACCRRSVLATVALAMVSLLALCSCTPEAGRPAAEGRWFKGNTHEHSRWSDGRDWPEMVAKWYKDHGYHFIVVTDHNTLQEGEKWVGVGDPARFEACREAFGDDWIQTREVKHPKTGKPVQQVRLKTLEAYRDRLEEPGRFLLIMGEEITGKWKDVQVHVNALNVAEAIPPQKGDTIEATIAADIDACRQQERHLSRPIVAHLNHPNWGGPIPVEQIWGVRDLAFFEVVNTRPTNVYNRGDATRLSTDRLWDVILAKRLGDLGLGPVYGVAADDSHDIRGSGGGWVVVRAPTLEADALMKAMRAGDFYASTGVRLKDLRREPGRLAVQLDPEPGVTYRIEFVGTLRGYDRSKEGDRDAEGNLLPPTKRYSPDIGKVLKAVEGTEASYEPTGKELYVRARVVSSRVLPYPEKERAKNLPTIYESAWIQPIVVGK